MDRGGLNMARPFSLKTKAMIKVKFLRYSMGHEVGEEKEYPDKHSGIIRAWVNEGRVEKIHRDKVDHMEPKTPEKVKSNHPPKTIKKKRK